MNKKKANCESKKKNIRHFSVKKGFIFDEKENNQKKMHSSSSSSKDQSNSTLNSQNLSSPSSCRVSVLLFAGTAVTLASFAYFFVTRFVFPLITEYHDQQEKHNINNNNNHNNVLQQNSPENSHEEKDINKLTLCLVVALSCAISTAVPGLFTISCLAAGFALDFFLGAFIAISSTLFGLLISFEAGRTFFRERASALVAARFPSAQNLSQLHPTKAVWVSWFFPVPLAIKIFFWSSCSNVSLVRFLASASAVAIPQISTLAFLGDRASSLGEGKGGPHEKVLFVLGCSSVIVATFALSRWAKSAVANPIQNQNQD